MKYILTTALLINLGTDISAQVTIPTDAIVAEGRKLYHSEMASWYGTDVFLEKFKDQQPEAGGYFSYEANGRFHCLFFSKSADPETIAVISFDSTYNVATAMVNADARPLTRFEKELYILRKKALEVLRSDTSIKYYRNIKLNLIPIIAGNEKKVFVLSAPIVEGVVVIGNDYQLSFDSLNNFTGLKRLHRNILPIKYNKDEGTVIQAMHTHLPETGDDITSTDICTLMLYSRFAGWNSHIVVSENRVSVWDCKKNTLLVITRDAGKKTIKK